MKKTTAGTYAIKEWRVRSVDHLAGVNSEMEPGATTEITGGRLYVMKFYRQNIAARME